MIGEPLKCLIYSILKTKIKCYYIIFLQEIERNVLDPQVLAIGHRYHNEMLGRHGLEDRKL